MVEPLEGRRLLAASFVSGDSPPVVGDNTAVVSESLRRVRPVNRLPDVTGTFGGELRFEDDRISLPDRGIAINVVRQDPNGALSGILTVDGLGSFNATGQVGPRRRVTLLFNDGVAGNFTGRVRRSGNVITGRLFANDDGRTETVQVRLARQDLTGVDGNGFGFSFDDLDRIGFGNDVDNRFGLGGGFGSDLFDLDRGTSLDDRTGFVIGTDFGLDSRVGLFDSGVGFRAGSDDFIFGVSSRTGFGTGFSTRPIGGGFGGFF